MLFVPASEEELEQFKKYADKRGLNVSEMIREVVLERIEDDLHLLVFQEAMFAYQRNPFSFSLGEVEIELGLV